MRRSIQLDKTCTQIPLLLWRAQALASSLPAAMMALTSKRGSNSGISKGSSSPKILPKACDSAAHIPNESLIPQFKFWLKYNKKYNYCHMHFVKNLKQLLSFSFLLHWPAISPKLTLINLLCIRLQKCRLVKVKMISVSWCLAEIHNVLLSCNSAGLITWFTLLYYKAKIWFFIMWMLY